MVTLLVPIIFHSHMLWRGKKLTLAFYLRVSGTRRLETGTWQGQRVGTAFKEMMACKKHKKWAFTLNGQSETTKIFKNIPAPQEMVCRHTSSCTITVKQSEYHNKSKSGEVFGFPVHIKAVFTPYQSVK